MQNTQTINNYTDLIQLSEKSDSPIGVFLESGTHSFLMSEVVEEFWQSNKERFQLLKLTGVVSATIQTELSILKLPALIVFYQGTIKAIFQGMVAKHELINAFSKIKS